MENFFNLCMNVITNVFDWIFSLDAEFQFLTYAVALFSFLCVWRFILSPILGGGSGSSDKARKSKKGGNGK